MASDAGARLPGSSHRGSSWRHGRDLVHAAADASYLWEAYGHDANASLIDDFARCVETGEPVPITGTDGMKAMEVALGAYRAADEEQPASLPLL
ncbi:MAG: hypothetical protein R6V07_17070 [Armatimonadota bacterium]